MISEEHIWKILNDYFKRKGFVHHQVESFDDFINNGISRIITEEPDILFTPKDKKYENYRISFSDVYIPFPSIIEETRELREFNPSEARQRDLTYDSPIYVTITETLKTEGQKPQINKHLRVILGRIPIMLNSSKCHLSKMTPDERIKFGECKFDEGGYFILKGKERVLIGQLRSVYNIPLVIEQKSNEKMKYITELRSMSEETGHSVLIQAMISNDDNNLVFSLPNIKEQIPFGIIFKAFGYTTQEEITDLIGLNCEKVSKYIRLIINDSYIVEVDDNGYEFFKKNSKKNWDDLSSLEKIQWKKRAVIDNALTYIGLRATNPVKDDERNVYAKQVIENEIFPHMGITSTVKEKIYLLGYMVHKLLATCIGMRKPDDRDNYIHKRVECAGVLCYELFRQLFKKFTNSIVSQIENKKQYPDIMSIIPRLSEITKGFQHCFGTGNWGVPKNSYIRQGVAQILSRLSYGATISNLRRISIPIGKESKNAAIRQINPSQIMFICPVETPEGAPVGTVLNLSLLTRVSKRTPTVLVKEIVENCENIILIKNLNQLNQLTRVFINGIIIGMTEEPYDLLEELKDIREIKMLPWDVSLSYDDLDDELHICSDEGRLLRPIFNIKDGKLLCKEEDGTNWDELVRKGVITYIDNMEANNAVIAFHQNELTKYHNDYCEIAPAMMFGIMASIIPFPDHSQSPRNTYQSAMGKQAMSMFALSHLIRADTIAHVIGSSQKPLVGTRSSEILGFNDMPSGINAIVAIACYTGFNQEDSIILNHSAVQRGLFWATSYRTHSEVEKKDGNMTEKFGLPPLDKRKREANYSLLDENGIVRIRNNDGSSVYVQKGDVIIGRVNIEVVKNEKEEIIDTSVIIKREEEGYIDRIFNSITPNGYNLVKIVIRKVRIPEVGDKFASRAAQKGTVGMVYRQEDMPFTNEGISPDIIINPHCIPSRMTINQLMESVLGKTCTIDGKCGDATPFTSSSTGDEKKGTTIAEQLCDKLGLKGYQRCGNEMLYNGMTGEKMGMFFIGPVYYQRLKHLVSDKIHARSTGPVTTLTRQPLEGRSRDGGLRFGEMERDCMIGHGCTKFLSERLFEQSDKYFVTICTKCGNFATTKIFCKSCNSDKVVNIKLPYVSKLVIQELNAMLIKTKFAIKY